MKKTVVLVCVLWLLTVFVPVMLLKDRTPVPEEDKDADASAEHAAAIEDNPDEPIQWGAKTPVLDPQAVIRVSIGGQVQNLGLDAYLAGVLAAEMPASFPEEALKAQAVAARSFIRYRIENPPGDGVHAGADLCDDPGHCKAYRDITDTDVAASLFGNQAAVYIEKIRGAVGDTDGMVLLYEGEAALAAFHAISGGMTESAETVWGAYVPYLVEVDSPGEEDALQYRQSYTYTVQELRELLLGEYPGAELGEDPAQWLTDIERSAAGVIKSASLGGVAVTGGQLRSFLKLNSADFSLFVQEDIVTITTTGYGHGVGMSQYGARAMAGEGADFREILLHYYPGCTLVTLGGW